MQVVRLDHCSPSALIDLFALTFTASEGVEEGTRIKEFVTEMLQTPPMDLWGFAAKEGATLIGAVLFSRMSYPGDTRTVVILSPAAVHPFHQGKGVGRALISAGLEALEREGIALVFTYGDPAFYAKVGFAPISPDLAPPPQPLSSPHGWLGQALGPESTFPPLAGTPETVPALRNPALW